MSSAICFSLDQSKILSSGKGLKKKILRKEENAINKYILLIKQSFEAVQREIPLLIIC